MTIENEALAERVFLQGMLSDDYFPNELVHKAQHILIALCERIEATSPSDAEEFYELTHAATEAFNELQEEFWDAGSEIETGAREIIADDFVHIMDAYDFGGLDIEEVIAPRDW